MASFRANGVNDLMLSLEALANLPDETVENMVMAGGEVAKQAQRDEIEAIGLVDTGKLRDSIKVRSKTGGVKNDFQRYALVYPAGTHHTVQPQKDIQGKPSKERRVRNAEVGFIQEFGAPKRHIRASQWMKTANEKAADKVVEAELKVYDEFLKSKDL